MGHLKFTVNGNVFAHGGGIASMLRFAMAADALGYDYIRLLDHVVGFVAEKHPEVAPTPYTHRSEFFECFTLMAYLSAVTTGIGFITGVLALPQRQTALVAKQAAQVDILSGGRLILGVGIGYNSVEFAAMGASFKDRAARIEEQIDVLRALWTRDVVTFAGKWHDLADINVNALPVQRPIPIWMGVGRTENPIPPDTVLARIGRYADGWMPLFRIDDTTGLLTDAALDSLGAVRRAAAAAGKDDTAMQLELGLFPEGKSADRVMAEIAYLESVGATHIHARFGDGGVEKQIENIARFGEIRDSYRREHQA